MKLLHIHNVYNPTESLFGQLFDQHFINQSLHCVHSENKKINILIKITLRALFAWRDSSMYTRIAVFQGMHVSPSKHSYVWLPRKCDYLRDRKMPNKVIPMCCYFSPETQKYAKNYTRYCTITTFFFLLFFTKSSLCIMFAWYIRYLWLPAP